MSRSMFLPAKASAADAAAGASSTAAIRPARNMTDMDDIDASAGYSFEPGDEARSSARGRQSGPRVTNRPRQVLDRQSAPVAPASPMPRFRRRHIRATLRSQQHFE